MTSNDRNMKRRDFVGAGSAEGAGVLLAGSPLGFAMNHPGKKRLALVRTGLRGVKFWGQYHQVSYSLTTCSPYEGFRLACNGRRGHGDPGGHAVADGGPGKQVGPG